MRRARQPLRDGEAPDETTTTYTFHFQMTNQGGRRACSVKIEALNHGEATTLFRQNWPMIESQARDHLAKKSGTGPAIRLAALVAPSMSAAAPPLAQGPFPDVASQAIGQPLPSTDSPVMSLTKPIPA